MPAAHLLDLTMKGQVVTEKENPPEMSANPDSSGGFLFLFIFLLYYSHLDNLSFFRFVHNRTTSGLSIRILQ